MTGRFGRWGRAATAFGLTAIACGAASCGDIARSGRSPSILVIDALQAASGVTPGEFHAFLLSDVLTLVKAQVNGQEVRVPTTFNDPGVVTLRILLKDAGQPGAQASPSNLNAIQVNRYRVVFVRSDGRNVQGVDVPYTFDGATTATVTPTPVEVGFEIVRHQAKAEAPLKAMAGGGGRVLISAIAEITFYGHDLAGNDVAATGSISVGFGDFGDPD